MSEVDSNFLQEIIKVRGWQVSPTELETCLLTHPCVVDVAVIGVDFSDDRGELPRAYVVVDPNSPYPVTDQEIKDYLGGHLAKYKALDGGVKRVRSIARNASGKILKKLLRDEAKQEILEERKLSSITNGI
jgi:acyl-coenzyme A synthetase/AMP-(fatty) acid ligase